MARILCVDDEPHVVTLKCAILEQAGHTATASTSARDAINKIEHTAFDAVVTDWRLGDGDGREWSRRPRSIPTCRWSWCQAMLPRPSSTEPLADLYLEKPVNPEELVTIVNELLKGGNGAISRPE